MVRVRHTTRCAGGCGQWLTVGQTATRLHRTLWCSGCATAHRSRCHAHGGTRPHPAPVRAQESLF